MTEALRPLEPIKLLERRKNPCHNCGSLTPTEWTWDFVEWRNVLICQDCGTIADEPDTDEEITIDD